MKTHYHAAVSTTYLWKAPVWTLALRGGESAGCLFGHFLNYTLRLQPWFLAYGARRQHRAFGASTDRRLPEAYRN